MNPAITELLAARDKLETDVLALVHAFEAAHGMQVSMIDLERFHSVAGRSTVGRVRVVAVLADQSR